jgi:hypothetical protein
VKQGVAAAANAARAKSPQQGSSTKGSKRPFPASTASPASALAEGTDGAAASTAPEARHAGRLAELDARIAGTQARLDSCQGDVDFFSEQASDFAGCLASCCGTCLVVLPLLYIVPSGSSPASEWLTTSASSSPPSPHHLRYLIST